MRTLAEGLRLYQEERYDEAARRLQVVCEFEPDNVQAWMYYGAVLGKLDHWPHAVRAFERVVALQPDESSGFYNLAHARLNTGDAAGAEVAIAHALALEPNNPAVEALRDKIHRALRPPAKPVEPTDQAAPPKPKPAPAPEPAAPRSALPVLLIILAALLLVTAVLLYRNASAEVRGLRQAARLLDEALTEEARLAAQPGEDFGITSRARELRNEAGSLLLRRGTARPELQWLRGRLAWERDRNAPVAEALLAEALAALSRLPSDEQRLTGGNTAAQMAAAHRLLAEIAIASAEQPVELDAAAEHLAAARRLAPSPRDAALAESLAAARQALRPPPSGG